MAALQGLFSSRQPAISREDGNLTIFSLDISGLSWNGEKLLGMEEEHPLSAIPISGGTASTATVPPLMPVPFPPACKNT